MSRTLGRVTLLPLAAVIGRTYRVDRPRTEQVASYVSVYDDGSAYCYACRRHRCRHVTVVLSHRSKVAGMEGRWLERRADARWRTGRLRRRRPAWEHKEAELGRDDHSPKARLKR